MNNRLFSLESLHDAEPENVKRLGAWLKLLRFFTRDELTPEVVFQELKEIYELEKYIDPPKNSNSDISAAARHVFRIADEAAKIEAELKFRSEYISALSTFEPHT